MRSALLLSFVGLAACSGTSDGIGESSAPADHTVPPAPSAEPQTPPAADESTHEEGATPSTLRVMSYNIKVGLASDLATIAGVIAKQNPDIVGLQEVDELTN